MAITATTLASAVASNDTIINVTSATGITGPNFTAGTGITLLLIDQEYFVCIATPTGTFVPVLRGQYGTSATAHVTGSLVQIGLPGDFVMNQTFSGVETDILNIVGSFRFPATFLAGAADALTGASAGFFVVKTAAADAITLATPLAAHEGNIISIWSDTAFAHTVTCPTTNFLIGAAANKTVCTFPARPGAGIMVRVCNLNYHLLMSSGTGTNSGPVVWT